MQQQKAGYILEGIQKQLKKFDSNKVKGLLDYLSCFDIESNIPESIDESKYVAYFKVINNQIVRGLPTKPSIYIEETFSELYGQQQRDNSNLAKVNFEGANLYTSSFKGANLFEANLLGANISGAIFEEANLSGAIWVDGKKCALGSIGICN